MDELGLPRVKLLQISFCPVDGRMLGWAGLGWAGIGRAGKEDNYEQGSTKGGNE